MNQEQSNTPFSISKQLVFDTWKFQENSYTYRLSRNAIDALSVARTHCRLMIGFRIIIGTAKPRQSQCNRSNYCDKYSEN